MFCDGKCEKGKKRCGLLYGIILEETVTGKVEEVQKCAFHHMADSFMRLEGGNIKLQAAVESSRNEKANGDNKLSSVVATGFIGMLHAMNENPEKFNRSLKILGNITTDKLIEED